ncbi:MAG TPA: serine hydrolase [Thermoanaerobaculia bacterium]|nr:serine hydrolase [Thermoanaerobaculia bacterium]
MQPPNGVLRTEVERLVREDGASDVAVAFYDFATETEWSLRGDRWFHAASTVKLAILLALWEAAARGHLSLDAPLHVRNRFISRRDGEPYRLDPARDADSEVYGQLGRAMRLRELAHHMIVTSSNLATNLLLDLLTPAGARDSLQRLGVEGIDLQRGVEDLRAHETGIDNRATAHGLLAVLRAIYEARGVSQEGAREMLDILLQQRFDRGIPSGLPEAVRETAQVANKTGDISTHTHDAGLVLLPERAPYAVVVLTAWPAGGESRQSTVARVSAAVYARLIAGEA